MKTIRKLIARLFNIGVDDLPQDQVIPQLKSMVNELKTGKIQVSEEFDSLEADLIDSNEYGLGEDISSLSGGVLELGDQEDSESKFFEEQERKYQEQEIKSRIQDTGGEQLEHVRTPSKPKSDFEKRPIRIGIDFGTSTTSVSLKVGDNLPAAALIGRERQPYMPSVVYFKPGESEYLSRAIVGEDAENMERPNEIIRSVKRCLGCIGDDCSEAERNPFPWCEGNGLIKIGGDEAIKAADVVYLIIREALTRAMKFAKTNLIIDLRSEMVTLYPVNLGCSVKFDFEQRQILNQVIKDLGFRNIKFENIIEEPILAGFTYSRFEEASTGRTLIYDFGGGTFDTAILDIDQTKDGMRVTVVSSDGDNWLGGDDFDRSIFGYFLESIALSQELSDESIVNQLSSLERSRLLQLARQAKEQLSSYPAFSDVLPTEAFGFLSLDISKDELETIIKNSKFIDRSLEATRRACKLAYAFDVASESDLVDYSKVIRYKLEDASDMIDHVLLVGGITKIPVIRKELSTIFGEEKLVEEQVIEPISAVAIGAAYPRESQHFSITVPAVGFRLEYRRSDNNEQNYIEILPPYEYLDFHKPYAINSCPVFIRDFRVPIDYIDTSLFYKFADDQEWILFTDIGLMPAGQWYFQIDFEGNVSLKLNNQKRQNHKEFPMIHPLQEKIKTARLSRIDQRQQEERNRTSGKAITMVTEK